MRGPARVVRAISIRQPYVEQILRGLKKREYRSRPTNIRERLLDLPCVQEADVRIVWDPRWDPSMMSEEARKRLGIG